MVAAVFRTVGAEWRPTGRYRPRLTLFGRLTLQIEESRKTGVVGDGPNVTWNGTELRWRAARSSDLPITHLKVEAT
jgi:hypothetical protein